MHRLGSDKPFYGLDAAEMHSEYSGNHLCVLKDPLPFREPERLTGDEYLLHCLRIISVNAGVANACARQVNRNDLNVILGLYTHLFDSDEKAEKGALEKAWQDILNDSRMHLFILEIGTVPVSLCALDIIPNLTRGSPACTG